MTAERVLTPAPAAYRRRWTALAALLLAEAMNLLDATVVQVAAPRIHAELGGSVVGQATRKDASVRSRR